MSRSAPVNGVGDVRGQSAFPAPKTLNDIKNAVLRDIMQKAQKGYVVRPILTDFTLRPSPSQDTPLAYTLYPTHSYSSHQSPYPPCPPTVSPYRPYNSNGIPAPYILSPYHYLPTYPSHPSPYHPVYLQHPQPSPYEVPLSLHTNPCHPPAPHPSPYHPKYPQPSPYHHQQCLHPNPRHRLPPLPPQPTPYYPYFPIPMTDRPCHIPPTVTPHRCTTITCHAPNKQHALNIPHHAHSWQCPQAPRPPPPMQTHANVHAALLVQIQAHGSDESEKIAYRMKQRHEKLKAAIRFSPTLPTVQEVPSDAAWQFFTPLRLAETRDILREWVKNDPEMTRRMADMEGGGWENWSTEE